MTSLGAVIFRRCFQQQVASVSLRHLPVSQVVGGMFTKQFRPIRAYGCYSSRTNSSNGNSVYALGILALPLMKKRGLKTSVPLLSSAVPIEISRQMIPDDTNPNGNVHGGTILKLIEQAANIAATRHCNKDPKSTHKLLALLGRVEHMDFHQPMYVGEVSQVQSAVTFTSKHSMEVTVDVWAENVVTGSRRHTNSAVLWYVATPSDVGKFQRVMDLSSVPQLKGLTSEEYEKGKVRYEKQKKARMAEETEPSYQPKYQSFRSEPEQHTVGASRTTLANIVLPSDCYLTGHMMGGSLMKMMDSTAGICAARHCRTPVVTICLDAINFKGPILYGEVVMVTAELVFASSKSMEIEVRVEAEGLRSSRRVTNTARFTFVSLGKDGHAAPVPPLNIVSEEEKERFEEGRRRYEERKRQRLEQQ